jgi:hypothetical protein
VNNPEPAITVAPSLPKFAATLLSHHRFAPQPFAASTRYPLSLWFRSLFAPQLFALVSYEFAFSFEPKTMVLGLVSVILIMGISEISDPTEYLGFHSGNLGSSVLGYTIV